MCPKSGFFCCLVLKSVAPGMLRQKSFKIGQTWCRNRFQMERKSTKNHQNWWSRTLLDHLWHISEPKVVPGSILGRFWEQFGVHFGTFLDLILICFLDVVLIQFLIDFWSILDLIWSYFWSLFCRKNDQIPKHANVRIV